MTDTITITGNIAGDIRHATSGGGVPITSFRVASSQRRYDRASQTWIDGEPNWYTVSAYRNLAVHAYASLQKGQRVIVTGRLKVRHWENGERSGVAVEIDAEAVGHDLLWGTTTFQRTSPARSDGERAPSDDDAPRDRAADSESGTDGEPSWHPLPVGAQTQESPGTGAPSPESAGAGWSAAPVPF